MPGPGVSVVELGAASCPSLSSPKMSTYSFSRIPPGGTRSLLSLSGSPWFLLMIEPCMLSVPCLLVVDPTDRPTWLYPFPPLWPSFQTPQGMPLGLPHASFKACRIPLFFLLVPKQLPTFSHLMLAVKQTAACGTCYILDFNYLSLVSL